MNKLIVHLGDARQVISFEGAPFLAALLREHGFAVSTPCGGAGVCNRCGVAASGGLQPSPLSGRVLACKTRLTGNAEVWLQAPDDYQNIALANQLPIMDLKPLSQEPGLAVDIGTTTLAVMLTDHTGQVMATAAAANPQSAFSDNVIGRISVALQGQGNTLNQSIISAIDALRAQACQIVGIHASAIAYTVITGNTAMLYFYLNHHPGTLSVAPFQADHLFGEWIDNSLYLPHCISAFLGADLLMAILASGMCERKETALLADIGTNGEIALWHQGRLLCTASAAGPAFEGGGISQGMGSVSGAIDTVRIHGEDLVVTTISGAPARGICGSGLIDTAAALLKLGRMDETGWLAGTIEPLTHEVHINQKDVRQLQLAKGAVAAAIGTLCHEAGISFQEISRFYLAGGFGTHMNKHSAAEIGLIPKALTDRTVSLGNAALTGAAMLLLNGDLIDRSRQLAQQAKTISLNGNVIFTEQFTQRMLFEPF